MRPVPKTLFSKVRSRQELIQQAKEFHEERNRELRAKRNLCDSLDVCALAYMHEALSGDGDISSAELTGSSNDVHKPVPLHRAIALRMKKQKRGKPEAKSDINEDPVRLSLNAESTPSQESMDLSKHPHEQRSPSPSSPFDIFGKKLDFDIFDNGDVEDYEEKWMDTPATPQQVTAVADWLTEFTFRNGWELLADHEERTAKGQCFDVEGRKLYRDAMLAMSVASRTLLSSKHFYHANLTAPKATNALVRQLVQLDRLPKENSLEGLLLLQSAWCDHDVAILLATRFKRVCKISFMLQLLLGWIVIFFSAFTDNGMMQGNDDDRALFNTTAARSAGLMESQSPFVHVIFGMTVMMTVISAVDATLNSQSRWRTLRSGVVVLESIIWKYRTRIGPFEIEDSAGRPAPRQPELALLEAVRTTRLQMLSSANLATSEFAKRYQPRVYRHFQHRGDPSLARVVVRRRIEEEGWIDDHQSPCQPSKYIALRIEPMMAFYQSRIPAYARRAAVLKLLVVTVGIAASVLARYELVVLVTLCTAAGAAITSWTEFSDAQRKTERYTQAVHSLRDLLDWWASLPEVNKASKTNINALVDTAESIISAEQTAWTSTPAPQGGKSEASGESQDQSGEPKKHS